jgi:hypothetical protein
VSATRRTAARRSLCTSSTATKSDVRLRLVGILHLSESERPDNDLSIGSFTNSNLGAVLAASLGRCDPISLSRRRPAAQANRPGTNNFQRLPKGLSGNDRAASG